MLLSFENDLSIAATPQSQIFIMEIYHACPEPGPDLIGEGETLLPKGLVTCHTLVQLSGIHTFLDSQ